MKNELVYILNDCDSEIERIKTIIDNNPLDPTNQYLNKYVVIKACGTIEFVFKSIIANFFITSNLAQVHKFINSNVRESSANPKYDKICGLLKVYDESWCSDFKNSINARSDSVKLKSSLDSLVDNRNAFAHGKNITATVTNVKEYFDDGVKILHLLDAAVK